MTKNADDHYCLLYRSSSGRRRARAGQWQRFMLGYNPDYGLMVGAEVDLESLPCPPGA